MYFEWVWEREELKFDVDDYGVKLSIMALYGDGKDQALLHDFKEWF